MLSAELLVVAFNCILFQRQLYQRHSFVRARKWGVPIMVCDEPEVKLYIKQVVAAVRDEWLSAGHASIREVTLIIFDLLNRPIERWQFGLSANNTPHEDAELRLECQAVVRQIFTAASFLPTIQPHTFRIAVAEVSGDAAVPPGWTKAEYRAVENGIQGNLDTVHGDYLIAPQVVYRM